MSDKQKLDQLAAKRAPSLKREVVQPVNIMEGLTGAPRRKNGKTTKPQVEKYTTHLRPATIKQLKVYAAQNDVDDYQVVQQALDEFLARNGH